LLVERAASHEWIVVTNSFADGGYVVFQAIQETASPRMVWEYRVPAAGNGPGVFRTSNTFMLQPMPNNGFKALFSAEVNRCVLQLVDPTTGQPPAAASVGVPLGVGSTGVAMSSAPFAPSVSASPSGARPGILVAARPTPLAAGANEPKSWGYDGRSFNTGDRILVDIGNRSIVAIVVQANGDQYYVHFEGAAAGTGEWIKPWRVTGRLRQ